MFVRETGTDMNRQCDTFPALQKEPFVCSINSLIKKRCDSVI